jgi:hypothetical protein
VGDVVPFPARSTVLLDLRGEGRALRVTWHQEEGAVVLSTWRESLCVSSVRLSAADAAELVSSLAGALAAAAAHQAPTVVWDEGLPPG